MILAPYEYRKPTASLLGRKRKKRSRKAKKKITKTEGKKKQFAISQFCY